MNNIQIINNMNYTIPFAIRFAICKFVITITENYYILCYYTIIIFFWYIFLLVFFVKLRNRLSRWEVLYNS